MRGLQDKKTLVTGGAQGVGEASIIPGAVD